MGRHVARMGDSRNVYIVLVGRPEGKRPSGMPKGRWEDNKWFRRRWVLMLETGSILPKIGIIGRLT